MLEFFWRYKNFFGTNNFSGTRGKIFFRSKMTWLNFNNLFGRCQSERNRAKKLREFYLSNLKAKVKKDAKKVKKI